MTIARMAADVLVGHTTLELECIDRLYINASVPLFQSDGTVAHFIRGERKDSRTQ